MFSGIVEECATAVSLRAGESGTRLTLKCSSPREDWRVGESIAVNGVCLTLVEFSEAFISFDLTPETVRRSTLKSLKEGNAVNIERSLKVGDRISGHFVFGHVDCTSKLLSTEPQGGSLRMIWSVPEELRSYIVPKGSVALDGVSLTVGEVYDGRFSVYIVPHTAQITAISKMTINDEANLEIDMLARYVRGFLERKTDAGPQSAISIEFLKDHGFIE